MTTPPDELMERLERANPVPAAELTHEEQRRADGLFERIVAEAPPAEAPPTEAPPSRRLARLRPRRIALTGACVAVFGLAVVAALDLLSSDDSSPGGVVERALAAVSADDAIYAVTERSEVEIDSLRDGEVTRQRSYRRWWVSTSQPRSRFLDYRAPADGTRGRLLEETVFAGDRMYLYDADSNRIDVLDRPPTRTEPRADDNGYPGFSPFADPGAQLRALVDEGRLRVAGKTTVRGRSAYRLVSEKRSDPDAGTRDQTVTYWVDARSYLPLRVRESAIIDADPAFGPERVEALVDYLSYRALPDSAANRAKLRLGRHPGAERTRGTDDLGEPPPPLDQQEIE